MRRYRVAIGLLHVLQIAAPVRTGSAQRGQSTYSVSGKRGASFHPSTKPMKQPTISPLKNVEKSMGPSLGRVDESLRDKHTECNCEVRGAV